MAVAKRTTKAKTAVKEAVTLSAKEYRLLPYQPLQFVLKCGRKNSLLVFDPVKGYNRAIRHCPGERSIFVDEQSADAVVVPLIFLNGLLSTKETETITQAFLEAHPSKDRIFELIDTEADAVDIADMEELKIDVKQAIRKKAKEEAGIEELTIIVSVLISDAEEAASMSPSEVKNTLYELVDNNINRFIDDEGNVTIFDDADIKRAAITQHAFNSGVIQVSADGSKVMWSDNKATICMIPVGQNHEEFFSKYLGTEEGLQVVVEISNR
tara:strand:- start:7815 stop:8618 length:804 start_codon:yes stop_codon:yes gene_type:complete